MEGLRQLNRCPAEHRVALAPGRVNLIGEHTDYNQGFVLPMGIDRFVAVAAASRHDGVLRAHSVDFTETREISLSDIEAARRDGWFAYVAGIAWALRESGAEVTGADLAITGDVPVGAGLASSAALEMAVARALCAASNTEWRAEAMALLGRRCENEFVGVNCGIMDQLAAATAKVGTAALLDCRSLEMTPVPIPEEIVLVVLDTGVRRRLTTSSYNERRVSCERAVEVLREVYPEVTALRDVDTASLREVEQKLDPLTYKRAMHVVAETVRPVAMADALAVGDLVYAGELMNASHVSLRDLYSVSSRELDAMVATAREQQGCFGARMTGAGFGGCAVALVAASEADRFVREMPLRYEANAGQRGAAFVVRPSAGARLV